MFQVTYIEIDDFRHWTEYPQKSECRIQAEQLSLARRLVSYFKKALVLESRGDSYVAITNGTSWREQERILRLVNEEQEISVSAGIGYGTTFLDAQGEAARYLHNKRRLRNGKYGLLEGRILEEEAPVTILHIDINNISALVDCSLPVCVDRVVLETQLRLCDALLPYGSAAVLFSGDNFIAPIPELENAEIEDLLSVAETPSITLKAGVGRARNPARAADLSGLALNAIRRGGYQHKVYRMDER